MSKELKACSKCGSESAVLVSENDGFTETFFVQCRKCRTIGPKETCGFSDLNRTEIIASTRKRWNDGLF